MMSKARDLATRTASNLVIPTSITKGASGTATVSANGKVTFSGTESIALDGCFTSAYDNYKVLFFVDSKSTAGQPAIQVRTAGSSIGGVTYRQQSQRSYNTTVDSYPYSAGMQWFLGPSSIGNGQSAIWSMEFINPANSAVSTFWNGQWFTYDGANFVGNSSQGAEYTSASRDGFVVSAGTGTFTGTVRVYGYNNG